MSGQAAIFLDRDGVLNVYRPKDYVKTPEELVLLPGAGDAVRDLNTLGFPVLVISNQQGVAKNVMSAENLAAVQAKLVAQLAESGGHITQTYYCAHHADTRCDCRKPQPGLMLRAAREHDLDLAGSYFVGDTETDALAARAAGVGRFVLVLTGKFPTAAAAVPHFLSAPDYIAADLSSAVRWIAQEQQQRARQPLSTSTL